MYRDLLYTQLTNLDSADRATQSKNKEEQTEADTLTLITTLIQQPTNRTAHTTLTVVICLYPCRVMSWTSSQESWH